MSLAYNLDKFDLPKEVIDILSACPNYVLANTVEELVELSTKDVINGWHKVEYDLPEGKVVEAKVCKVRNGIAANYIEPYMRRRDPDCMLIADDLPTDKVRYKDIYNNDFTDLRHSTFEWLKTQELIVYFLTAGPEDLGMGAVILVPANAAFFALGLALLQGIINTEKIKEGFKPKAVVYVAPPFRHTHFKGKQKVVHNRLAEKYEMFSYNLYPGPSAKKGIYGMLINLGEKEQWPTLHCSTVQVVTPYQNKITISHEGASGGGKSEMLEDMHRERNGRLLLGYNTLTEEKRFLTLPQSCDLNPVTDDMAVCHTSLQKDNGKLNLIDAESAWFIRVDHITEYGTDPHLEKTTCKSEEPLLFLNIDAAPNSTALIWEHIEDAPGQPCPNPRVILPRQSIKDVINEDVTVDVRSFGVRTPLCTREKPSYGIIGLFHVLPPALAWAWRLVAPRGHANPSIVQTEGMSSEGVGSYWPFATGKKVEQANLLLKQIIATPKVKYILCPNQHIGVWKVGFMPQWITRDYLARRGGAWFTKEQIKPARCPLLGYALQEVMIEGQTIEKEFLQVDKQEEVGKEAYDQGSEILTNFFQKNLLKFMETDLLPLGKQIIEVCLAGGTLEDYVSLINTEPIVVEQ